MISLPVKTNSTYNTLMSIKEYFLLIWMLSILQIDNGVNIKKLIEDFHEKNNIKHIFSSPSSFNQLMAEAEQENKEKCNYLLF